MNEQDMTDAELFARYGSTWRAVRAARKEAVMGDFSDDSDMDHCAVCGQVIVMRDNGISTIWSHDSETDGDHAAVFRPQR